MKKCGTEKGDIIRKIGMLIGVLVAFVGANAWSEELGQRLAGTFWHSYVQQIEDATSYPAVAITVSSQREAELAFADALAAIYLPTKGRVIGLFPIAAEATWVGLSLGLSSREDRVTSLGNKTLAEFVESVAEELNGKDITEEYLLKLPYRGRGGPFVVKALGAPTVSAQGLLLSESFETDPWTRWIRTDETNGQYQFERTSCSARTGAWSLDAVRGGTLGAALGCSASYPASASTSAAYGQWLTFSGYSEAWLDFYLSVETERDYDEFSVVFFDEQNNWGGWLYSGTFPPWFHAIFNLRQWYYLGDLTQGSRFGLALGFTSDSSVEGGFGARVDDLSISVNQRPNKTCSIIANPTSGPAPLTVRFSANQTGFTAGASYYWDFRDGATSSAAQPEHVFTNPGDYDVVLGITESNEHCHATQRISVTSAPPTPSLQLLINQVDASACPTVKAYVSVFDGNNAPAGGLTGNNFELKEDGVLRPIAVTQVGSSERVALALVLDTSGSITEQDLANIRQAAITLVNMLGPNDLVALWEFKASVYLRQDYTSDKQAVIAAINAMSPGGQTALYDAIYEAAEHSRTVTGRKSMVVMTDGEDNASSYSMAQAIAKAVERQIPVFTVGFGSANAQVLGEIASQTGGVFYPAASSGQLQDLFQRIGNVLANQYLITWTAAVRDGSTHTIEITVRSGNAAATKTVQYSQAGTPCALAFTHAYFLPTVTHGGGLYQSVWRSDVSILNPNSVTSDVLLVYYGTSPPREKRLSINPGAQALLPDVLDGMGQASGSGILEIKSTLPVKVMSRVFNLNQPNTPCYPGATLGQNIDAFTTSRTLAAGQSAHLLQLSQVEGRFRTNILLANIGDATLQVRLELFSGNGVKLYEYSPPITLAPKQAQLEVEPFKTKAGQTNLVAGYAKVTVVSGSGLVALASMVDSTTQDPTTIYMLP